MSSTEDILRALLSCAPDRERVRALTSTPGAFELAFEQAMAVRLGPTLHEAVFARWHDLAPPSVRAALGAVAANNASWNADIRDTLLKLGAAAKQRGFEIVPLKGAAWLFDQGDHLASWRFMADLDVLVEPRRFEEACQLALDAGWQAVPRYSDPAHGYCRDFTHDGKIYKLEIHRDPGYFPELLSTPDIFETSTPVADGVRRAATWVRLCHAIIHWRIQDRGLVEDFTLRQVAEIARFAARSDWIGRGSSRMLVR